MILMSSQPARNYSNQELADLFSRIANLLEIKGEVIYKILAYRKAADSLENLGRDAADYWRAGQLTEIAGIGKAIAEKIDELYQTGKLGFLERLEEEVPPTLIDLLQVPDLGPKKVSLFWKKLQITNLAELEAAALSGQLRRLPGMGEKSEARILAGIQSLARRSDRIPLGKAWPFAQNLLALLRAVPGVEKVELAGSLRRMRSTIGDVDLQAAASDSGPLIEAFCHHPDVERILSQGAIKASLEFRNNLRAQLWVHPPGRFGTALQYATGSKDHNVRLRELAIKRALSLSDQGFLTADGSEILCSTEEEVYATLGLPWIPPELREDRGEVQAALKGELPHLIQVNDIRAELHSHTRWSDGRLSIREMAQAAIHHGLRILAITDHSASLGVAGGLSIADLQAQRAEIQQVQAELGDSIRLLQGCEVEIRADGALDFPDEILAGLDIVIAALHTGLRQPRSQVTERALKAIRNPHVDILAHPTGRMIPNREGADLDMDALFQAAGEHNVALEINAHPSRLDLDDINARRAVQSGLLLAIDTDAHSDNDLEMLQFGVATARRGWVEPPSVINTWDTGRLLSWLANRG